LQAHHQDRGGGAIDLQRAGVFVAGEHMLQLVMHDLDDLLARGDRFGHGGPGGFGLNLFDEIAGNR